MLASYGYYERIPVHSALNPNALADPTSTMSLFRTHYGYSALNPNAFANPPSTVSLFRIFFLHTYLAILVSHSPLSTCIPFKFIFSIASLTTSRHIR